MKKLSSTIALLAILGGGFSAAAGEGHDHGVPGAVAAPKGGEIQPALGGYLELVRIGNVLKIYPYDGKTKALPMTALSDVEATAEVVPAKNAKPVVTKLVLKSNADHFETSFDPKKSHLYTLKVAFKINGKADSVAYKVERN